MPNITFFRQRRRDGGVRTGVDIGKETVLSKFVAGKKFADPILLWYVDVRAEGKAVPSAPEPARQWLSEHTTAVQQLLGEFATDVPAGVDPDYLPLTRTTVLGVGRRQQVKLTVSAAFSNRAEASRLPRTIRNIATSWKRYVSGLDARIA